MKKIDKLLITGFIGPFFVTFLIAIFVLMMQYLWLYVDELVGKGAGFFMVVEMLSYLTISLVPMALPIAILISSVMVMGNLAERYELSSMKSAGVSLARVMMPLTLVAFLVAIFSFFCNDSLIPISNLKFKSRLYDIRKQRPTLSIEPGLFNDDFEDIIIRVDSKKDEDGTVEKVLIYDHSSTNENRLSQITAESGKMYTTNEGKYFVMDLADGTQFNELKQEFKNGKPNYPFIRTNFRTWTKVFDMSVFSIEGTDEELFKSHHTMQSTRQLMTTADSLSREMDTRLKNYGDYLEGRLKILNKVDSTDSTEVSEEEISEESKEKIDAQITEELNVLKKKGSNFIANNIPKSVASEAIPIPQQIIEKDLSEYKTFAELFYGKEARGYYDKAKPQIRAILTQSKATQSALYRTREKRVKHIFEMHFKFSLAFSCVIFLFIGAPMGAIVRKGGFGYPILVSIVFFMVFITLNIMCKKLAESNTLPAVLAAWMPCLILLPVGIFLTRKAMNDEKVVDVDRLMQIFRSVGLFFGIGSAGLIGAGDKDVVGD